MAWTTPKTWATGELVTADLMNVHVRDNLNFLMTPNFAEATMSNFSTTSLAYVDIPGSTISITTKGGNLLVWAIGNLGASATLAVNINGTDNQLLNLNTVTGVLRRFVVAAGTHTVKLRLAAYSGTANWFGDGFQRLMVVEGVI